MSIISRLFYKIRVALSGGHDYDSIYDTDDEYDIPHTPNKDVQSYLDYPSKPTGITLFQSVKSYPSMQTGYRKSICISVCLIQT